MKRAERRRRLRKKSVWDLFIREREPLSAGEALTTEGCLVSGIPVHFDEYVRYVEVSTECQKKTLA